MKHQYACTCGKTQDREYGFSETKPATIACSCGKRAKRKIGVPTFQLKGDGWASKS